MEAGEPVRPGFFLDAAELITGAARDELREAIEHGERSASRTVEAIRISSRQSVAPSYSQPRLNRTR